MLSIKLIIFLHIFNTTGGGADKYNLEMITNTPGAPYYQRIMYSNVKSNDFEGLNDYYTKLYGGRI